MHFTNLPVTLGVVELLTMLVVRFLGNLIQPTISLEMPVPSQGHYGFHSFLVVV
jgi:hypothetical protein